MDNGQRKEDIMIRLIEVYEDIIFIKTTIIALQERPVRVAGGDIAGAGDTWPAKAGGRLWTFSF